MVQLSRASGSIALSYGAQCVVFPGLSVGAADLSFQLQPLREPAHAQRHQGAEGQVPS